MRNLTQNKLIDHFISHIGKLPESTQITIIKKINTDSHEGSIIEFLNEKSKSMYFVGIEKNFGTPIIEK